jgi:hypothetical protein
MAFPRNFTDSMWCGHWPFGHVAWLSWSVPYFFRYEAATDTFVVRDGRIAAQSFAAKVVAKQ